MFIEIRRTQFVNKGAELMLYAIIDKLRKENPKFKIVMAPDLGNAPYIKRSELGLYQKIWLQYYNIQWGKFGALIPKKLRDLYGMILDSELDVILDASGFSYSDQKNIEYTVLTAKAIKKWRKRGTKVIFMPQAFGPFTGKKIKESFKIIVENADLIFAREKVSYNYISELMGDCKNVKIAPDFTNLVEGISPPYFDKQENRFCIIPNYRMIDKTEVMISEGYLPFLLNCIQYLYDKGVKPFILIHEGAEDLYLGKQLVKKLGKNINIIREENPIYIKGIIGSCLGVLSSRYHGLVSALSQGIPAIGTGWSHKYEMLFRDYHFHEGIVMVNDSLEDIYNKVNLILIEKTRQKIKKKLLEAGKIQKQNSTKMWDDIFSIISIR